MPSILVVDDEPMITMLLTDWLSELGYQTLGPCQTAASALALIAATTPDGAIIDVTLGAESSYPVADYLAKQKIPFLFATGHGEGSTDSRFAGIPYLAKPFDFNNVRDALYELFPGHLLQQESVAWSPRLRRIV